MPTSNTSHMTRILNPDAHTDIVERSLARRLETLDGKRPGILANRKQHARAAMEAIVHALGERYDLGPLTVEMKPTNGPPSRAVMRSLTEHCDFVFVGSCD